MAKRIFISATNTDIGKTFTTLKLIEAFNRKGVRVGALKPIETGISDLPPDGTLLLEALQKYNPETASFTIDDVVPIQMRQPAAPFVASGGKPIDLQRIDTALAKIEAVCDVCLIEGAGGLLVPIDREHDIIDLIGYVNAKALLVSHCHLGCINDLRLGLEALERRGIAAEWVLNCREDDHGFAETSQPYFDTMFEKWYRLERDIDALCDALLL